jgi:predicted Zn-dependent peptidase
MKADVTIVAIVAETVAVADTVVAAVVDSMNPMNPDPYRNEIPPHREVLPGGAVLLSVPMRTAHAVTFGVWLRTGSEDEPLGLGGISHFLEHMVFKGTEEKSAFEIASTFDSLGASVDAFTTKDLVAFTVKVLPEYFPQSVELLAEMLLNPAFDAQLVSLEQDVVIEEIQEALDTPEDRLHDAFAARLYGSHMRGKAILGTPGSVRSFSPSVLKAEHSRLFAGPNMVISLSGNIQDHFADIIAESFGMPAAAGPGWTNPERFEPETSHAAAIVDIPLDELNPFLLEINSPIIQTYFEIGNLGMSFRHDDRIPLFLLNNLLGGGMSSRVFQAVREREGLAYTIYNYTDMGKDTGLVSCSGSCSPDKVERLIEVVQMEYMRLLSEGVPAHELEKNRAQIKSQLIFSLEGMVNQMFRSARNEIFYGRFVPVAELVDQVDNVSADDINRCTHNYYNPDSLLVAIHGPESGHLEVDIDE